MRPLFLHGHTRPLTWIQFNRDGDLLFTCGKDSVCALWRAEDGTRLGTYDTGNGVIWSCDVTHDSKYLICASADQRILIFDVLTSHTHLEISEDGPVKFVEWNKKPGEQNRFVVAHDSFGLQKHRGIKLYGLTPEGSSVIWAQYEYGSRCTHVHWGPYDETIISCHENGDVMVWKADTGEYINSIKAHNRMIPCISFSEDRLLMLSCCSDGSAKLWRTTDFKEIKTYLTDRPLNACGISPRYNKAGQERKCHLLFGGGQEAELVTTTGQSEGKFQALLYHMVNGEEMGSIRGHFGPINTLAWMPNGNGYASGGEDGYVRIYTFDDDYFTEKFE